MTISNALWNDITRTAGQALQTGALLPVPTRDAFIDEGGVLYLVRVLGSLKRKDEARSEPCPPASADRPASPFLPPEPELTVGPVGDSHIAVLNKYNVMNHHLLIVTREFEEQTNLLTLRDFEALWSCMSQYESIGFYNGGVEAGASQRHKHLQVVPLPLAPKGPAIPLEPLLNQAAAGGAGRVQDFPFLHGFAPMEFTGNPRALALRTMECYSSLLMQVGMTPPREREHVVQSGPYSLLVTRRWMLLVPRSRERYGTISLNSLAFAGSFFVRDNTQLEELRTGGVMTGLRSVAVAPEPRGEAGDARRSAVSA